MTSPCMGGLIWKDLFIFVLVFLQTGRSLRMQSRQVPVRTGSRSTYMVEDPDTDLFDSFSFTDKLLFQRSSKSVANEIGRPSEVPRNYQQLISMINSMTFSRSASQTQDQGKNMLKRLFPGWLLSQYKVMFARPFPRFSAWMNAWVTHFTTNWLMGNSTVVDLVVQADGSQVVLQDQALIIEKCRFLETAGCVRTCLHACKAPTQRFFLEEMGLPVTLIPNMTDYSCRFEFGVMPVPLVEDPISLSPCLASCPQKSGLVDTPQSSRKICL